MKTFLRSAIAAASVWAIGVSGVQQSFGQISLTASTIPELIGKQVIEVAWDAADLTGANALRDNFGANRTWDVTGIPFVLRDTTEQHFLSGVAGTVGEDVAEFAGANVVTTFSELDEGVEASTAIYWENSSDAFKMLGVMQVGEFSGDGVADTLLIIRNPAQVQFQFPFSFGTVISDSVTSSLFNADTLVFERQIALDGEVDGWGKLITPAGQMDVLRYRFERRTYSMGLLTDVSIDIEWWNEKGLVMGMEIDDSGNGADLSYFDVTVSNPTRTDGPQTRLFVTHSLSHGLPPLSRAA